MRARVVPILAAGLVVVGCGGAQQQPEVTTSPPGNSTAPGAAAEGDAPADDGVMTFTYEDADSPEAVAGRTLMQDNQLLEDLSDDINEGLMLPTDIALLGAQCDEANAFWDPEDQSITLCYEDAALAQEIFTEAGDPDPVASALNSEYATFYHEVGHMVISIYELPATGREEDVADQLAAYVLLQPDDGGEPDPESVQAVKDFARTFSASGDQRVELSPEDFADVHSLDETRVFNLQCWIYGSNPDANGDLVASGDLPADRADGCEDEWILLDRSWSTLLEPYFK
ncbi:DUF4344 domain-containing metallopeptidase [Mycolicibacterium hippocampi]|uniref:Uncharacterized protein n=1 Tax=Mycolicibacterium hippocampi TaxID=659824 RepID=A0A7I9ZKG0_9MYCO|nr:DUF4344 domain-containing metallopeptidase [Mycolicibacterium hippocampi]GFH01512.1 hypothetical protein MHIP_19950 [Mycolicibacterium hippocampi]